MECLLLQIKFESLREASHHVDFMGNCQATVTHTSLLYLPRRWVFFSSWLAERNEHADWI